MTSSFVERWLDLPHDAIVYEDEDVIVVNKPAHVSCQSAEASEPDDLPMRVRRVLAARTGVSESEIYLGTHQRLDQDTSGLVLYTLRKEANAKIAPQFEQRTLVKSYVVAVQGDVPKPDTERVLANPIAPGRDGKMIVADARDRMGKPARTRIRTSRTNEKRALLEATIETGRTHQIRVQLSHIGLPVAGDVLYGGAPALRLMLHAHRLVFKHPRDDREVEVHAPLPLAFEDWLEHGTRPAYRDAALLTHALGLALERRFSLGRAHAAGLITTFRLAHEEADGLPGLAVEVFADWLVLRVLGEVTEPEIQLTLDALHTLGFAGIYLKRHPKQANDMVDPHDERVAPMLPVRGEPAPEVIEVCERDIPYEARLFDGLRTGLFLDQRDNRRRVRDLAADKRVLNLFSYTGSFSVAALVGGSAYTVSVDSSRAALRGAERNVARIGATDRHRYYADDAFDVLERLRARGERFDLVIVDPPSYSTSKRGRFRVTKDYPALCRAAFDVLNDQGIVLASLNHHGVAQAALRRYVYEAARAAGVEIQSLKDLGPQRDFPSPSGAEPLMKSVLVHITR